MIETVLKFLVLPPVSLFLLYGLGLLAGRRWPRTGAWLRHGSVALLFVISTGVGSWLLARPLESLEAPLARMPAGAQAIVVLSAGRIKRNPERGNTVMPDFIALERMSYAGGLARASGLPLLVTGGLLTKARDDEPLAYSMQRVFKNDFGLPVRWVEAASRTTAENASLSAPILQRDGVRHIVLVTDAMHMRRARRQFEQTGLTVTAAPTFFTAARPFTMSDLSPSAEHLRRSYYAIYEWLALARDMVCGI